MYATVEEIATRLGRSLDPAEEAQITGYIEDVTGFINGFCRRVFVDPVPSEIKAIARTEVIRLFNTDPGLVRDRTADVELEFASTATGLSRSAQQLLSKYRGGRYVSVRLEGATWLCDPLPDVVVP